MATFGNDFINSKASTDVNVVGFAGNALDGILKAIQATKEATDELRSDINENADGQERRANSERVASVASERRQRAANAAIHGKIDKGFTLMGLVQKSLEKIASYVGDIATRTMKSLDDSVKTQRKLILSSAQIVANQKTASRIAGEVRNYGVSPTDVRKMTDALAEQGMLATDFSDKQLKLIAVAMNKNNMSAEKAVKLALQSRGEEDSMIKTLIQATDLTGRKATEDMLSKIDSSMFQIFAKSVGGTQQGVSVISDLAKQLDSKFGMYMGAENQTKLIDTFMKLKSGQIELVGDDINALLGLGIDTRDPTKIADQIMAGIKNNKFNENNVQVLRTIEGFGEGLAKDILSMQNAFNAHGNLQTKKIRPDQENIDAAKASVEGGTAGNWLSNAFTKLDVVSGGLFSGISTQLNEWFGEDASLEGVVKNGFPVIIGLLSAIVASKIIGNPLQLFAGIASLGLFKKITGFFKKGDKPEGDKPDGTPKTPKTPRDLNKEYEEAIEKLKGWPDSLKKSAKEAFEKLKAVPGHIQNSASKAFDKIKQIGGNAFSSIKNAFKDAPRKISDTFSTIKKRGVIAMTKIPGMFKGMGGMGGKIGKGILGGLGIVSGALGLLGATGAFDSLTPILENFTKAIAPVLTEAVNTLAPTIQNVLDLLVPIINDVVKALSPILDSTLKALAPILVNIVESLVPIIKIIAELTTPILKVVTPILKVIGTILERISPVIQIALKPIAWALELISKPLQAIAQNLIDPSDSATGAAAAEENAKKSGDLVTAKNAAIARAAYSQGFTELERYDGESDKDYYDRAAKEVKEYSEDWSVTDVNRFKRNEVNKILKNINAGQDVNQILLKSLDKAIEENDKIAWSHADFYKDDFYGKDIDDWREYSLFPLIYELKKIGFDQASIVEAVKKLKNEEAAKEVPKILAEMEKDSVKFATGGIVTKATNAIIGEAGKEAVVPLERPEDMRRVLSSLSSSEKFKLIKALLGSNSKKLTWDLLASVMLKTLGIGSFGPTAQEKSEYDIALAKLDAWRGGKLKPADFIAMFGPIAREDMRATGIPAAITIAQAALESGWGKTAKSDFRNLFGIKGKGDAGSKIIPTHEYNAAGIRYNKRDTFAQYSSYLASINAHSQYLLTAKRKKGLNGLRYGEALLYTDDSDMFARKLKECGYATSPTYAEKLIGLMRQHDMYRYNISSSAVRPGSTLNHIKNSTDFKAASATKSTTNGTVNKAQGILSDAEIKEILSAAGLSNTTTMKQYIEYAKLLVGNANSKDDIITVLLEIARYLKGIAAAPANKPPMMSVARPYTPAYGT